MRLKMADKEGREGGKEWRLRLRATNVSIKPPLPPPRHSFPFLIQGQPYPPAPLSFLYLSGLALPGCRSSRRKGGKEAGAIMVEDLHQYKPSSRQAQG